MNNKFFVLSALSFVFGVQGMKLPNIENFGCKEVDIDSFVRRFNANPGPQLQNNPGPPPQNNPADPTQLLTQSPVEQRPSPENVPQQIPKQKRIYAVNILSLLSDEKAKILGKAIGTDTITCPDMIGYLEYLGVVIPYERERVEDLLSTIDDYWPLIKGAIERNKYDKWVDVKRIYKTKVQGMLAPILGESCSAEDAIQFLSSIKKLVLGATGGKKCIHIRIRYVKRRHERVWWEIFDHWPEIEPWIHLLYHLAPNT